MTGLREPNVVCMFLWLNVCRTGWYHLLSDTHVQTHRHIHTHTPHWFNRTVLLDFAHGHYTSTYQKNRYWVERGGGATAIKKTDPAPWHGPLADRLPSHRSTSLCAWGSKVSRTCSPVAMLQIVHWTGDSPHGRVSLPTQPYAFYILYPCEWQIKTRQVYLTNASAFLTLDIVF